MLASPEKPQLTFLGPFGTYSHQAAFEFFGDSVEYVAQSTIADVQRSLSSDAPFGIIPHENSTYGSVVETYDVLRLPTVGEETYLRGVTVFEVKHSLVTRRGVKLENIETVLSHEQALGQCREWLARHLPRASLVSTDSTAGAAQRLLSVEDGLDTMKCAAICSSVVVTIYEGLQILSDGIQDATGNFTRFYILSYGRDIGLPRKCSPSTQGLGLLRFQCPPYAPPDMPNIPQVISMLDLIVTRVDRRPSLYAKPFDDVYFIEVSARPEQDDSERSWTERLRLSVDRVRCMGLIVSILGCW